MDYSRHATTGDDNKYIYVGAEKSSRRKHICQRWPIWYTGTFSKPSNLFLQLSREMCVCVCE